MNRGRYDITPESLEWARTHSPTPDTLDSMVKLARSTFGWFSKHLVRAFEYPWIVHCRDSWEGAQVMDIGAGISPLPLYLAELGAQVQTIDKSPVQREYRPGSNDWTGWGFLDYSRITPRLKSLNTDITQLEIKPDSLDCIYSVSVIEHMPAEVRQNVWHLAQSWLKPNGQLLVTVDIVPKTDQLWNLDQGKPVESFEQHGTLESMKEELDEVGFELEETSFIRTAPHCRTDCALLKLRRSTVAGRGAA